MERSVAQRQNAGPPTEMPQYSSQIKQVRVLPHGDSIHFGAQVGVCTAMNIVHLF